jgi:hypothetical protein
MALDFILRPPATPARAVLRAVARRAPANFDPARFRVQPRAVYIARLTATAAGRAPDDGELEHHLAQARRQQDRLAPVLRDSPGGASAGWPLRGEMLVHLDRLTSELQAGQIGRARAEAAGPRWPAALRAALPRPGSRPAGLPPEQQTTGADAGRELSRV